jgi:hypothetical protein
MSLVSRTVKFWFHILQDFAKEHASFGVLTYSSSYLLDFTTASITLSSESVTCGKRHEK